MKDFTSMDAFAQAVIDAGLGRLSAEELALLKTYYDGARTMAASLRDAFTLTDEPATVLAASRPGHA